MRKSSAPSGRKPGALLKRMGAPSALRLKLFFLHGRP
jgi:hypothetical protein